MKKLLIIAGLSLIASGAWAACMGPFCWDDKGSYVNGVVQDGNGAALPVLTKTQAAAATPTVVGQIIWCSNCTSANAGKGMQCASTATVVGSFIGISSATAVTACQ